MQKIGHQNGVTTVRKIIEAASKFNIKYLTLFTFSVENWDRPTSEVDTLMGLLVQTLKDEFEDLFKNNIKLNAIGDLDSLPNEVRNVSMLFAQKHPDILEKIIIVDIIPKNYKPHHQNIMDSLKSIDFKIKKSRKEVDDHMSNYIEDERVRQFLLKNLYWIDKESLGLKINIDVLYDFKDKLSLKLQDNLNYQKPTMFLYGDSSPYVKNSDLPLLKLYFTNVEIFKVPQAGHWVHADNPSFFLNKVINFLN